MLVNRSSPINKGFAGYNTKKGQAREEKKNRGGAGS